MTQAILNTVTTRPGGRGRHACGLGPQGQLEKLGHVVIGHASGEADAAPIFTRERPDLVLLDIRLDGIDGIDLATRLLKERRCPMIILSASATNCGRARRPRRVFGYLISRSAPKACRRSSKWRFGRFDEQERLRRLNLELEQTLESRKLIERRRGSS